jgi:glycosyltransferase involved in cell wall biosynthesis
MKVLLVTDYGYLAGGAEHMMRNYRDELRRRGHDAMLFATDVRGADGHNFADRTCIGTDSRLRTVLQVANPWAAWGLTRLLREFRPDIVHVRLFLTQMSPLILPLLEKIPSIYHVAWYRPVCPTGTKMLPGGQTCLSDYGPACLSEGCLPLHHWAPLMVQMHLLRRWRRNFDRVVANSQAVKSKLEEGGFGPVDVVYNGIPVLPPVALAGGGSDISFVGRLVPEKGLNVLLDAFALVVRALPDVRLLIAGEGPARPKLEASCRTRGLEGNVIFLGQLGQQRQREALRTAKVHAVPSLWAEPFGIVAVEAMSRGQAVVASDHGGLAEIVLDGVTGRLVRPGDPEALAGALLEALRDPERAASWGQAGYRRAASEFSLEIFADRFIQLYRGLLPRLK